MSCRARPHQPYELRALLKWLAIRLIEPLTNLPVFWEETLTEIIAPLTDICKDSTRINNLLVQWATMGSTYKMIGIIPALEIQGLAPRVSLQNTLAYEWEAPVLAVEHVSYVYVSGIQPVKELAAAWGVHQYGRVHVDGDRSHIILTFILLHIMGFIITICIVFLSQGGIWSSGLVRRISHHILSDSTANSPERHQENPPGVPACHDSTSIKH